MTAIGVCAALERGRSALRLRGAEDVATVRRRVAQAFRSAGLESPELDARVLVAHAFGLGRTALFSAAERLLSVEEAETVMTLAGRRLAREPVARIVGRKEFWGLEFDLTPAALVPRPDSETVVEAALAAVDAGGSRRRPLKIADLGTGSGALLIALLCELPAAWGIGTDLSPEAAKVARDNAARLGCGGRAAFAACDFSRACAGGFDLVVCNPPYIPSGEIAALDPEVRDHDPRLALDGGSDGLTAYRMLAGDVRRLLASRGQFVVEVGAGAAPAVTALFTTAGLRIAARRADLAGVVRALTFAAPEWV